MGFGSGTVLIIYLTTFLSLDQREAQGINLLFFVLTGIFALFSNAHKGLIEKRPILPFLLCALPGLLCGYLLLPLIETELLKKLFGGALIMLGVKELVKR